MVLTVEVMRVALLPNRYLKSLTIWQYECMF